MKYLTVYFKLLKIKTILLYNDNKKQFDSSIQILFEIRFQTQTKKRVVQCRQTDHILHFHQLLTEEKIKIFYVK